MAFAVCPNGLFKLEFLATVAAQQLPATNGTSFAVASPVMAMSSPCCTVAAALDIRHIVAAIKIVVGTHWNPLIFLAIDDDGCETALAVQHVLPANLANRAMRLVFVCHNTSSIQGHPKSAPLLPIFCKICHINAVLFGARAIALQYAPRIGLSPAAIRPIHY